MIGGKAGIFETRNWIEMEEWINSEWYKSICWVEKNMERK